jgi:hypothetical protein
MKASRMIIVGIPATTADFIRADLTFSLNKAVAIADSFIWFNEGSWSFMAYASWGTVLN